MIKVLVVPPEQWKGTSLITITNVMEELQELVGGYIELLYTDFGTMIMNEDGLLYQLPRNIRATSLAGRLVVGTVVMVGNIDRQGNWTDYKGPKVL